MAHTASEIRQTIHGICALHFVQLVGCEGHPKNWKCCRKSFSHLSEIKQQHQQQQQPATATATATATADVVNNNTHKIITRDTTTYIIDQLGLCACVSHLMRMYPFRQDQKPIQGARTCYAPLARMLCVCVYLLCLMCLCVARRQLYTSYVYT